MNGLKNYVFFVWVFELNFILFFACENHCSEKNLIFIGCLFFFCPQRYMTQKNGIHLFLVTEWNPIFNTVQRVANLWKN